MLVDEKESLTKLMFGAQSHCALRYARMQKTFPKPETCSVGLPRNLVHNCACSKGQRVEKVDLGVPLRTCILEVLGSNLGCWLTNIPSVGQSFQTRAGVNQYLDQGTPASFHIPSTLCMSQPSIPIVRNFKQSTNGATFSCTRRQVLRHRTKQEMHTNLARGSRH
jgi:hypothetical protein